MNDSERPQLIARLLVNVRLCVYHEIFLRLAVGMLHCSVFYARVYNMRI